MLLLHLITLNDTYKLGRTPLDKGSVSSTTHNIHKKKISMPLTGFESAIPTIEPPQTYVLDRAASGTGPTTNILYYNT